MDLLPCDESPLYGKSAMHPQADCIFSNNLLFHKDFDILWNKRYEELNNETKRQVSDGFIMEQML